MVLSVLYIAFQRVLQLVILLFRSPEFKELEIVVLRPQLAVPRKKSIRTEFQLNSEGDDTARETPRELDLASRDTEGERLT